MRDLFGLDRAVTHDDSLSLLTTVYDNTLLAVYESILRDAEIPYLIKERGSGSAVKVITGFSMFGTDLFVKPEHLKTATALITPDEDAMAQVEENEGNEGNEA